MSLLTRTTHRLYLVGIGRHEDPQISSEIWRMFCFRRLHVNKNVTKRDTMNNTGRKVRVWSRGMWREGGSFEETKDISITINIQCIHYWNCVEMEESEESI